MHEIFLLTSLYVYPDLQSMFDDAREEGVFPVVREGFRTHEEQVEVFEDKVAAFMREEYRRRKAEEMAEQGCPWLSVISDGCGFFDGHFTLS